LRPSSGWRTLLAAAARARSSRFTRAALAVASLAFAWSAPASAQAAGSVELDSQYRVRGYSISAGKPAASLDLSYDWLSGFYLDASAIGSVTHGADPVPLGVVGGGGYARRLGKLVSVDVGVVRSEYFRREDLPHESGYTELYTGIAAHGLSARLYYSFDYYRSGVSTLYGEAGAGFSPAKNWRLSVHGGALGYLRTAAYYTRPTQYDWSANVSRQLGAINLHASLVGGGPGRDYYDDRSRSKTSFVLGARYTF
jgi:uncharacterized protein (TIGR02001 family)